MCQLTPNPLKQTPLSPLPIPDLVKQTKKSTSRLKFWEINSRYHCSALGTCLTLKELRKIGKKAGIKEIANWTDYEIHVSFISTLEEKCYVSTLVNKLLDKKHKKNILHFSKTKTDQDRVDLWNTAVVSGDITGAFWAILTHPDTTEDILFQVYGKVHMLSHLSGATARINMRDFHTLEQRNQSLEELIKKKEAASFDNTLKLESQIKNAKTQLSTFQEENKHLKSARQELEIIKNNPLMENYQAQLKQLNTELNNFQDDCKRAESSEQKWMQRAIKEQDHKRQLEQQLIDLREEKLSLENTLGSLLNQQQDGADNCISCPNENPDLCGRCILYIGGRGSQYSHFRQLVEQQNGKFIHHDGGREDGHQKLASNVSKADIVLCPLDCVSHTAMNAVKRHCQNNTKQLVFIPHASLSAFSKGLDEVMK